MFLSAFLLSFSYQDSFGTFLSIFISLCIVLEKVLYLETVLGYHLVLVHLLPVQF